MSKHTIEIVPAIPIPAHLVKEIQSKFAYVDERIVNAVVSDTGDQIILQIDQPANQEVKAAIEEKVQRVVTTMAKGAIQPKVEIIEDYMHRPVIYQQDPNEELIRRGELAQETTGVYTLGPLISRLIDSFEQLFIELAESFDAQPYRFPVLIPTRYMARVNYFRSFPHSLVSDYCV